MRPLEPARQLRRAIEPNSRASTAAVVRPEVDEFELPPIVSLPREHPAWSHDSLNVSERASAIFTRLPPIVLNVLEFWDHVIRMICVGNQRLCIDASGSYRLE